MKQYKFTICFIAAAILLIGCSKESISVKESNQMIFSFSYPNASKVTDTGFEQNDKVGIYITKSDAILESAGNYVTNNMLTYNGQDWNALYAMYWNSGIYNMYAYYPYVNNIASVTDMPFSISLRQDVLQNYMESDFLWASKKNVSAGNTAVSMQFAHKMSRIVIKLVASDDYEGTIPQDAKLFVHNIIPDATVDLNAGIVTVNGRASSNTLQARNLGNNMYTAIVVPQRISTRVPFIELIMDGVSYLYESSFLFKQGVQHNVTLVVSKNPNQIKIEIGGEIEGWA